MIWAIFSNGDPLDDVAGYTPSPTVVDLGGAEAALAHKVRNPIEAAYRRTNLFERRRQLLDDWAC